jgi:integrase
MRRHGEGTIVGSGDKWRVGLSTARGREWLGPFATREEADAMRRGAVATMIESHAVGRDSMTLAQYGEVELNRRELGKSRSSKSDRNVFKTHLAKAPFADLPIGEIRTPAIRRWIRKIARRRAVQTAKNILNLLRVILRAAVDEDEIIDVNPADGVRVPVKRDADTEEKWTTLDLAELHTFADVASPDELAIIGVAVGAGLRQGEQRCLKIADVIDLDGDHPELIVRFGAPGLPTKGGKPRHVPLFGLALNAMRWWIKNALPTFKKNPKGLVFPSERGSHRQEGHMLGRRYDLESKQYFDRWKEVLSAAGIERRFRWHDLRHTCASWLLDGVQGHAWALEEVQGMLGHESITTTQRYAHAKGRRLRAAVDATTRSNLIQTDQKGVQVPDIVGHSDSFLNRRPRVRLAPGAPLENKAIVIAEAPTSDQTLIRLLAAAVDAGDAARAGALALDLARARLGAEDVVLAQQVLDGGPLAITRALRLGDLLLEVGHPAAAKRGAR